MYENNQSSARLGDSNPNTFHLLWVQRRHQDEGDWTNTKTIAEAREDQAGDGQSCEAGEDEAEPHHHHCQGVQGEEDDVDNPTVQL